MQSKEIALKVNNLRELFNKMLPQFKMVLPKHLTADRLFRIALTEARRVPRLLLCNSESFISCIMECARLGLEPGGLTAETYLIPYNDKQRGYECQLIVGYKGMIKLCRNTGDLKSIQAESVYSNDLFEIEYGTNSHLKHVPSFEYRGNFIGAYAIINLVNGGYTFIFITKEDIEKLKNNSLSKIYNEAAKKYSPWITSYDAMAAKTAIRRLFKYMPISIEERLARAIALDDHAENNSQHLLLNEYKNTDISENDFSDISFEEEYNDDSANIEKSKTKTESTAIEKAINKIKGVDDE